ncbi:MAG: pyridoxamine 5'-phosphate oxidase family protein [Alphaproteobacteria bacterium]|jgi:PPOX class probable FMN-dependent enzyme|nr:pyridoxamine 5'-phosphate oxidase family protein [Alphaproteobacteria bacterium]
MARLNSTEDLRRIIAEPRPTARSKILDALDEQSTEFLKRCPFALVGTTAEDGTVEVSPKGDEPGFIRIEDSRTLLIPERVGNNLAFGLSNILATGKVGIIALVPATGETLRISGTAEIYDDADLLASLSSLGKPALLATRVHIKHCYFHCARSIVRAKLWDPKAWPAPGRISFGKIIAKSIGESAEVAAQIDANVESAYTTRLWQNS